jgi:hypothetical protein
MPADAALGEVLLAMVDRAWQDRFGSRIAFQTDLIA